MYAQAHGHLLIGIRSCAHRIKFMGTQADGHVRTSTRSPAHRHKLIYTHTKCHIYTGASSSAHRYTVTCIFRNRFECAQRRVWIWTFWDHMHNWACVRAPTRWQNVKCTNTGICFGAQAWVCLTGTEMCMHPTFYPYLIGWTDTYVFVPELMCTSGHQFRETQIGMCFVKYTQIQSEGRTYGHKFIFLSLF